MKSSAQTHSFLTAATAIFVASLAALASEGGPAGGVNWPMFRGNPALTGIASGTLPDKLSLLWSFKTGGPVKSSAAIVDGHVFIGSGDGNVYALDLASGKKGWAARTGGPVDSSHPRLKIAASPRNAARYL